MSGRASEKVVPVVTRTDSKVRTATKLALLPPAEAPLEEDEAEANGVTVPVTSSDTGTGVPAAGAGAPVAAEVVVGDEA